jgi:hypothetical protein
MLAFAWPAGLPKAFGTKESRRFKLAERSNSKSSFLHPLLFLPVAFICISYPQWQMFPYKISLQRGTKKDPAQYQPAEAIVLIIALNRRRAVLFSIEFVFPSKIRSGVVQQPRLFQP